MKMKHEFVDSPPDKLEDGVIYISIKFATILHNCACGCGLEVVTPISPSKWKFMYDGESISLYPSVHNWTYPCKSHYWISKGNIEWSRSLPETNGKRNKNNRKQRKNYYESNKAKTKKRKQKKSLKKNLILFIRTFFKQFSTR